jgi:hypothetical protein
MLTGSSHYKELLRVNHVANTIAVMFRRSVIDEVGGFGLCCSPAEDYDRLLRAARSFGSAHLIRSSRNAGAILPPFPAGVQ